MKQYWEEFLSELVDFKNEFGHCYILPVYREKSRSRRFVFRQIELRKTGELSKQCVDQLNELGIDWNASGSHWLSWEKKYCQLYSHVSKGNSPNVSQLVKGVGPWLSTQRVQYREGILSDGRQLLLEELGVSWNPSELRKDRWEENFELLLEFKREFGHCDVPRRSYPIPGVWVSAQRTAFRKGRLSKERIAKLEEHGFNWKAVRRSNGINNPELPEVDFTDSRKVG